MYDQKCHAHKSNSISQTHQTFDVQKWRCDKSGLIITTMIVHPSAVIIKQSKWGHLKSD